MSTSECTNAGCKMNGCNIINHSTSNKSLVLITGNGSPRADGIVNSKKKTSLKWMFAVAVTIVTVYSIIGNLRDYRLFNFLINTTVTFGSEEEIQSFIPKGWSDVKLLIYMTTHLPPQHVAFLPCWKDAIERLTIFKHADLMIYTSTEPTTEQLEFLPFQNITIKNYTNPGYQPGAVQAMVDPFLDNVTWFDDYDWVIRVNPDVLIRDDKWLIQSMLNTSVDMIVHDCYSTNKYTTNIVLHTDFFAFRPNAVDRLRLLQADRSHAETHFSRAFRHLYDEGRFAYVEGGKNAKDGICRIAGVHSPVLHVHELSNFCPYYYNVTKEGFYR